MATDISQFETFETNVDLTHLQEFDENEKTITTPPKLISHIDNAKDSNMLNNDLTLEPFNVKVFEQVN